jgi:hypothetical protein
MFYTKTSSELPIETNKNKIVLTHLNKLDLTESRISCSVSFPQALQAQDRLQTLDISHMGYDYMHSIVMLHGNLEGPVIMRSESYYLYPLVIQRKSPASPASFRLWMGTIQHHPETKRFFLQYDR